MNEERVQRMARLYVEQGLSYAQIGEEYGITRQRVGQLLSPLGLAKVRGPQARAAREQKLRGVHERIVAGELTPEAGAAELGYSKVHSLRDALLRLGLKITTKVEPDHGTVERYTSRRWQCRCDECRRANREHAADRRASGDPPEHGYSGYKNYGCRCQKCKEANRLHNRAARAARRQRREVTV